MKETSEWLLGAEQTSLVTVCDDVKFQKPLNFKRRRRGATTSRLGWQFLDLEALVLIGVETLKQGVVAEEFAAT